MHRVLFWAALLAGGAMPAAANDSAAAIGVGGLELRSTDAVAMVSEALHITPDRIDVRYVYRNETDAAVTALVAFPLPEYDVRLDPWGFMPEQPGDVDFTTVVNGEPVALEVDAIALLDGVVRSADLKRLGLPMQVNYMSEMARAFESLSEADREWLLAEGLIDDEGEPQWTLQTVFLREQTFPPGEEVLVEHSYHPLYGGATWSWFPGPARDEYPEYWASDEQAEIE